MLQMENRSVLHNIEFDLLKRNPHQPRRVFNKDRLSELAGSIKDEGLIQPIVARKINDHYEIIVGERRWRACQLARIKTIPVLVRQCTDEQSAIAAISENTQREDLSLLEMAHAFSRLNKEFSMTHDIIGQHFKINAKNVTHILRLLTLSNDIQDLIEDGHLKLGHAKVILSAPQEQRAPLAKKIMEKWLSVRAAEKIVKSLLTPSPALIAKRKDTDVVRLEQKISEVVGLSSNINYQPGGSGKIEFKFASFDELEGLLVQLKVSNAF